MTHTPLIWAAGLLTSVVLHIGAGVALLWSVAPEPVTDQSVPETRMQLSAYQVDRSTAIEAQPDADAAQTEDASGSSLDQGAIPQSRTQALDAQGQTVSASSTELAAIATTALSGIGEQVSALSTPAAKVAAAEVTATSLSGIAPQRVVVGASASPSVTLALATPSTEDVADIRPQTVALTPEIPDAPKARASDVFAMTGDDPIDPVSLAAFQNFVTPSETGQAADQMRDEIGSQLAQVPCARMQVQFQPETNALVLIGHIPKDGHRAPALTALQAQMGQNIRVVDKLLILPSPQCGALSGIADVGLPQSTDQITNPMLVGEDVHAREFRYTQGQQLVLDLTGADYDAYIYVDYFDANGQVIHLSPNDVTPLTRTAAKSALKIGAEKAGDPGLFITIGPPYGQEIAVAFAASEPLYDGIRPIAEPAAPYLEFLKARVAERRAANPGFKGEWVYFFVVTAAG